MSDIRLGDVRVHVLGDGTFALDGGALFGVVPRALWEKTDPPDEMNRVRLGLNVALIESGGRRILVDTGLGDKWGEKETRLLAIDRSNTLLAALAGLGLGPDDIDVVVNTHLHFDHAGGNTRRAGGRVLPTFPRARYVVQLGEWEDATHPHERSRASYLEENYVPLAEARQLETVQGAVELAPGVRAEPVGGHTAYHQVVFVEGGGETLVVPTDVLPTTSHVPLAYVTGYDLFPVGTLEVKRRLLSQAVRERWRILFYHDARTAVARVEERDGRYRVQAETALGAGEVSA
jgi:glyoxylase-like metal-dependent hydrolase (beta-lactamase superfamily II)